MGRVIRWTGWTRVPPQMEGFQPTPQRKSRSIIIGRPRSRAEIRSRLMVEATTRPGIKRARSLLAEKAPTALEATALSLVECLVCDIICNSFDNECDPDENSRCSSYSIERETQVPSQADLDVGMGKSPMRPLKGMIVFSSKFLERGLALPFPDAL